MQVVYYTGYIRISLLIILIWHKFCSAVKVDSINKLPYAPLINKYHNIEKIPKKPHNFNFLL